MPKCEPVKPRCTPRPLWEEERWTESCEAVLPPNLIPLSENKPARLREPPLGRGPIWPNLSKENVPSPLPPITRGGLLPKILPRPNKWKGPTLPYPPLNVFVKLEKK